MERERTSPVKALPTFDYDDLIGWGPCWKEDKAGRRRLLYYKRKLGGKATAMDILRQARIPAADRLWVVLREECLPAYILHEFACRCAEAALALVDNPDPRSVAAIEAKRRWLRGEISDDALAAAWDAARGAAQDAARAAAQDAARDAALAAARYAARAAAWDAAWDAAEAAARDAAWDAARDIERSKQVSMLIDLLKEEGYVCASDGQA